MTVLRVAAAWFLAFARFWYRFIVGDDWTLAVAVVLGLGVTALLSGHRVTAWWLVPAIVIATIGASLVRSTRTRPGSRSRRS